MLVRVLVVVLVCVANMKSNESRVGAGLASEVECNDRRCVRATCNLASSSRSCSRCRASRALTCSSAADADPDDDGRDRVAPFVVVLVETVDSRPCSATRSNSERSRPPKVDSNRALFPSATIWFTACCKELDAAMVAKHKRLIAVEREKKMEQRERKNGSICTS